MRAKTVKRLVILIAVFVLIGGSAYAIWRIRVEKMAQGVVAQAERAMEKQDYAEALELLEQHLLIFPDDQAVQLKYADALLKMPSTPKRQESVMAIYNAVLTREPGRVDVRRRAAELAVQMKGGMFAVARTHLSILMKSTREDGHLEYLMGRCYEEDKDVENAAKYYRDAIEHGSPERREATLQLAALVRENEKLGKPEDADRLVDEMVKADPDDYRVYLDRGHYRRLFGLQGAGGDFRRSLEIDREQPDIYLEIAEVAERNPALEEARRILETHRPFTVPLPSALDVARQVLDNGLEAVSTSPALYKARAELERRAGRVDRCIEWLERGVKAIPDQPALRIHLALIEAAQGDTGKLLLHIEELRSHGVARLITDYLTAYYCVNNKEFEKARRILTSIQAGVAQSPDLKSRVNVLLAQCYGQLHEPELQFEANQRAFNANPDNLQAQMGWTNGMISRLVNRGEVDEAIKEYRRLLERVPQVDRMPLVNLMVRRNRQRPPAQRNWGEVEVLLEEAMKAAPASVGPVVQRAMVHAEQGQEARAWDMLEAARLRFPESVEPWTAEADVLVRQKKFGEALGRLDEAEKRLGGDRIELRIARASIWAGRGGPQEDVVRVLRGLAENLEPFPKEKRRGLLAYLAGELGLRQDVKGAEAIWSRLAAEDRADINPRVQLFELALQAGDQAAMEAQIKAIGGIDETYGRFCRARYLTWQAGRSRDEAEGKMLRTEARGLLAEVKTRRNEWERVPVAEAALDEQELAQAGLDEALRREKQESLINLYLSAIELGSRNLAVMRRTVELLFTMGRSNEAVRLIGRIPALAQVGGALAQQVLARAVMPQGGQPADEVTSKAAEEMARLAITAKPDGFQERLWLVNILMAGKRTAEAEAELRRAVAQADGEPVRWLTLVNFLIQNKELAKAEQALRDAEKKLAKSPLAMAEGCELMGRANEGPSTGDRAKKWYNEARRWFDAALAARKDPKDQSVTRSLVQFLLRTNPVEAEKQLKEVLGREAVAKDAGLAAWARRTLALMYINGNPRRPAEALALLDEAGPQSVGTDPEDRRVRARVLVAQGTPEHRRGAIASLESLVDEKLAIPEDQLLLARLEEAAGDWPKSRDQYRSLIERTPPGVEGRKRQLAEFAERLLQRHQPEEDRDKDLAEAQEQIEKLKRLQPDLMVSLNLEVALHAARNDFGAATALIRATLDRPDLNATVLPQLAVMAERIGPSDQFKLAEEIYRKLAAVSGAPFDSSRALLVRFLVRRERFPEVIDLCESLRKGAADRTPIDALCIEIFANPGIHATEVQINRVAGWFEQEIRNGHPSLLYRLGLANLNERLGDDQKAKGYYRAIISRNEDRDGIASNNLAWLMALSGDKSNEALALINHAIELKGRIPDYLDTRGVVLLSAGESQRAITDLKEAIAAQPTASKYFHLAQAYLARNDKANARTTLEVAKTRGLPVGLHRLEMLKYKQMCDELGMPSPGGQARSADPRDPAGSLSRTISSR